ncbi:hypothetical protein D3C73_473580 [compost metagenome]
MHGEAETAGLGGTAGGKLQRFDQRRAFIPRHRLIAGENDILALQGRHRNGGDLPHTECQCEFAEFGRDLFEHCLVVTDQVDLVDRQHELPDAHQRRDRCVPTGLFEQADAGVSQKDGEIGGRGAGHHVAGILLVAGCIGDDEGAAIRGEIAIGDIDRDALFAFCLKAIEQQREIGQAEIVLRATVTRKRRRLVFLDRLGVPEKPADQGRLAVIDGAAGDQAQRPRIARNAGGGFGEGNDIRRSSDGRSCGCSCGAHLRNIPRASSFPWSRTGRGRWRGPVVRKRLRFPVPRSPLRGWMPSSGSHR